MLAVQKILNFATELLSVHSILKISANCWLRLSINAGDSGICILLNHQFFANSNSATCNQAYVLYF